LSCFSMRAEQAAQVMPPTAISTVAALLAGPGAAMNALREDLY
jgi:hypothetical protein